MKVFGDLSSPETYDLLSSKSKISANKKMYYGNPSDYGLVFATWASYIIFSLYFLVVISPYFWVDSSPAITIVGICLSIPGLYNAVKCFLTGSHCNNCIKEFDHHCYFMGNCIGERNQLNFFLFLFFSSMMVTYDLILSIISFIDNISTNAFVFEEFYNNQPLFIVFVSIVGAGVILNSFDGCDKFKDYMKILSVLMIAFAYFWIAITNDVIYYRNPVIPLLGILVYIVFAFVLFPRMLYNGFLACIGSTLKQ